MLRGEDITEGMATPAKAEQDLQIKLVQCPWCSKSLVQMVARGLGDGAEVHILRRCDKCKGGYEAVVTRGGIKVDKREKPSPEWQRRLGMP